MRIRSHGRVQSHCPSRRCPSSQGTHAAPDRKAATPPASQTRSHDAAQGQPAGGHAAGKAVSDRSQISTEAREADRATADAGDGKGSQGAERRETAEHGGIFDGIKSWMTGGHDAKQAGDADGKEPAKDGKEPAKDGKEPANDGKDPAKEGEASGLRGALTGLLQKVMPGLPLNDAEKKQVAEATETLKKLAGEDGRWDGRDLRNNLQQMQGSLRERVDERIQQEFDQRTQGATRLGTNLRRRIGQRVLDKNYDQYVQQGMGIARQTAMDGMVGGQDQAGVKRPADYNGQANTWKADMKPISTEEMERFGATMKMIDEKSRAAGYPRQTYQNGIPVKLLESIRDGRLPVGVR